MSVWWLARPSATLSSNFYRVIRIVKVIWSWTFTKSSFSIELFLDLITFFKPTAFVIICLNLISVLFSREIIDHKHPVPVGTMMVKLLCTLIILSSQCVECDEMMWSVSSTSQSYRSLVIFVIVVSLSVSDQFLEEDRHGHGVVTRVSYQDHHVSPRRVIVQDRHISDYNPGPRRVIVRKKVIRPRSRVSIHHVDRPLAVVPSHSLHPVAGHEECYKPWKLKSR